MHFVNRIPQRIEKNVAFVNDECWAFFRIQPYSYSVMSVQEKRGRVGFYSDFFYRGQEDYHCVQLWLLQKRRDWESEMKQLMDGVPDDLRESAETNLSASLDYLEHIAFPDLEWIIAMEIPSDRKDLIRRMKKKPIKLAKWELKKLLGFEIEARDYIDDEVKAVLDEAEELGQKVKAYKLTPLKAHEVYDFYRHHYYRGWEMPPIPQKIKKSWSPENSLWIPNAKVKSRSGDDYVELQRNGESRFLAFVVPALLPTFIDPPKSELYHEIFYRIASRLPFVESTVHFRKMSKDEAKDYAKKRSRDLQDKINHVNESSQNRRLRKLKKGHVVKDDEHEKEMDKSELYERLGTAVSLSQHLKQPNTTLLDSHFTFVVWGYTKEQLDQRVAQLIEELENADILPERPTEDQRALFESWYPATEWEGFGYQKRLVPAAVATLTTPGASDILGDPRGVLIGFTENGKPVFFDPTYGISISRNGNITVSGELGSGKSHLLNTLLVYAVTFWLANAIVLDPKLERTHWVYDPARGHQGLPKLGHITSRFVLDGTKYPGVLDPFRIIRDKDKAKEQAISLIDQMLQGSSDLAFDRQLALMAAAKRIEAIPTPRMKDLRKALADSGDHIAKKLADYIGHCAELPQGALIFGEGGELDFPKTGIVILQPEGLKLPENRKPEDMLEGISLAVMSTLSLKMLDYLFEHPGYSVGLYDEAWTFLKTHAGKAVLERQSRLGRSKNVSCWFATQRPSDIESGLMELIGCYICLGTNTDAESDLALEYLKISRSNEKVRQDLLEIGSMRPEDGEERLWSQGYMRDLRDRAGKVEFVTPYDELRQFFNTRPKNRSLVTA